MLIDQIKSEMILAKKEKDTARSSFLACLLSDCIKVGKDSGNRDTLDLEVYAVIKKYLKGIEENLKILKIDSPISDKLKIEKQWLNNFLPKQLSSKEMSEIVDRFLLETTSKPCLGQIMSFMKDNYNCQYDSKVLIDIINNKIGKK